jgi:DNA-binding NtrC family response regulator
MMNILIADDDKFMRNILEDMLVENGCTVNTVQSGGEVIRAVLSDIYDAVFLDLHINGMDGVELIQAVKMIDQNLPIVIITGDDSPDMKKEVMMQGVIDYILKPIRMKKIKRILTRILY